MTPAATSAGPVRDVRLRIRGLRIHAQVHGEGEPLLLYSGVWGEVRLWERLLPHLAGFQTIAFDPPGIGRSQRPAVPLSMWGLAHLGTAVLDEFGIDSAHVLGVSFGGAVAQQMAFSHSSRVRRLASTVSGSDTAPSVVSTRVGTWTGWSATARSATSRTRPSRAATGQPGRPTRRAS